MRMILLLCNPIANEDMHDQTLLKLSLFLLDYFLVNRLFTRALDAIERAGRLGLAALLSDGDKFF